MYSTTIRAARFARAQTTASVAVMSPLATPWVSRSNSEAWSGDGPLPPTSSATSVATLANRSNLGTEPTCASWSEHSTGLFHPLLDLGDGCAGAVVVELAARRSAHAERPDRFSAGHDGHAADRVRHIGQRRLRHRRGGILGHPLGHGFRAVFPAPERQRSRRVRLVEGVVERVDRRSVAPEQRLADTGELDADPRHRVALPGAGRDRP